MQKINIKISTKKQGDRLCLSAFRCERCEALSYLITLGNLLAQAF